MSADGASQDDHDEAVPEPQGRIGGIPYDLRRPTVAKFKSRWWNPADPRFFTPRALGMGWDLNLYWLAHPTARHRAKQP